MPAPKPSPCFSHLPWFIRDLIIDDVLDGADFIRRCALRKVSKDFMSHIDPLVAHFDKIEIQLGAELVRLLLCFNGTELLIKYRKGPVFKLRISNWHHVISGPDHLQQAVTDLGVFLKSSRVTVGVLIMGFDESYQQTTRCILDRHVFLEKLNSKLDQLPHKLNVSRLHVTIKDEEDIYSILSHLKPQILEDIVIRVTARDKRLDRVVQSEQWRQAKRIECQEAVGVSILAMAHLNSGAIFNSGEVLELEEFKQFYQMIQVSPNFQNFAAECSFNFDEFKAHFTQLPARYIRDSPNPLYFGVRDTAHSIEIDIERSTSSNDEMCIFLCNTNRRRVEDEDEEDEEEE